MKQILLFSFLIAISGCGAATTGKDQTNSEQNKTQSTASVQEPDMILVKGGTFNMGTGTEIDESPVHKVTVGSFRMGKYEVTVGEFRRFIKSNPSYITDAEKGGYSFTFDKDYEKKRGVNWECDVAGNKRPANDDNHPVIHVSRNDAVAYCVWLSRQTGKHYRLPTEAEWEYAAKGGANNETHVYSGSDEIDDVAWYEKNSGNSDHPVGQKKPNSLGIYDLSGNVWEWCEDHYGKEYYSVSPQNDPTGPLTGADYVLRGGSWYDRPQDCRPAARYSYAPDVPYCITGFRIVASE